jgi:hypothetical protein
MKLLQPVTRYYLGTLSVATEENLEKRQSNNQSLGPDLTPRPPEYKGGVKPRITCWIENFILFNDLAELI